MRREKHIIAICFLLLVGTILCGTKFKVNAADSKELIKKGVYRIYGENRYETSLKVAEVFKEQSKKEKFENVIVSCGTNFADALTGNYLASKKGAPVLLAGEDNEKLCTYIKENIDVDGTIYILGGTMAVSEEIEQQLAGYNIKRIWGATRFETNIEILKEAEIDGEEILVCTAYEFADSLSVSAIKKPILLVDSRTEKITKLQDEFLSSINVEAFYIIGGENAVGRKFENAFSKYGTVQRIGGMTRFDTSVMVAEKFFHEPKNAILTYGRNFPDGLCGGSLSSLISSPLLLVDDNNTEYAEKYTLKHRVDNGAVLGGAGLINNSSVRKIFHRNESFEMRDWENVKNYTINYVVNGGVNHIDNPTVYTEGEYIVLKDPQKNNYTFKGWYKEKSFKTKIEQITPKESGNYTLYAKWNLEPLNISGEGMDNMIWSWWYYPQVISSDEEVYWGYATNEGYCGVARYDKKTDKITKTALKRSTSVDDHNGLAVTKMSDERIMCVYAGGHNSDNEIHVRISDKPNEITAFSTDIVLESSGKTCYGQIIQSRNKYYIFYRVNNSKWAYRFSKDGRIWSDEIILVTSNMQYYCRVAPTTEEDIVRVCMYSNPTSEDPRIRMGFLNLGNGEMYNSDGKTYVGTEKINYDVFNVLIEPTADMTQRMFDVAVSDMETTRILYAEFSSKAGRNDSTYYLYDSGESYEICKGGVPLWDPKYQLGAAFVGEDKIVIGRNEAESDYIELYTYKNQQIELLKELDVQVGTASSRNARPIVDVKGNAILWHNGYYNIKSYKDFNTSARMYLVNADKILGINSNSFVSE